MLIYATPAELGAYLDPDLGTEAPPPLLATVRLRAASALVREATVTARYAADADGLPIDPSTRAAMRDATLEHAQALVLHDIDPRMGAGSLKATVASKSLAGASVSYQQNGAAQAALATLAGGRELVPSAWQILADADLITGDVSVRASTQRRPIAARSYDPTTGVLDPL